jgi:hypothetical protein
MASKPEIKIVDKIDIGKPGPRRYRMALGLNVK